MSKARLDFPEPDNPVMTISLWRGSVMSIFFRLCCRAPLIMMYLSGVISGGAGLQFKGSGFYLTDYVHKDREATSSESKSGESASGSKDSAKSATPAKSETPAPAKSSD